MISDLGRTIRLSLRQLWRKPGFTITVLLTLALAIGANTAIFSLANALLLRDLPYSQAERLATIYARQTGASPSDDRTGIDGEKWELLRDDVPSLISAVSGSLSSGANVRVGAQTRYLRAGRVSAHYLDVLGVRPLLGRNMDESEDRPSGANVAVLSYALWHSVFASDPGAIGRAIFLKGEPYTVVGVLPEGAITPLNADLYTPIRASRDGEGQGTNFEAVVRLKSGATWAEANQEINRAWAARASWFAQANPGAQVVYYAVPLQKGQTASVRPQVLILMAAAGFILLIACANLAGLTLVRMQQRRREIATRLALGASSWQLQKQLWIENLLLAFLGGIAGIFTGYAALQGLLSLLPQNFLPTATVNIDWRVLAFTLALSLLTSLLVGMTPAFMLRRVHLHSSDASRSVMGGESIVLRQLLVGGEVALTLVLLAASGLLIRTLVHLETLPPGFNVNGVLSAKASLDDARYRDPANFRKLLDQSVSRMRAIADVQDVAVGLSLPYERSLNDGVTLSDGQQTGRQVGTDEVYVTPSYFSTLEIPVLSGRTFADSDGPDSEQVVIVNRAFAAKFFPNQEPIGHHVDKRRIVGVVADTLLSSGLASDAAPITSEETIYLPASQIANGKFLAMVHTWFQPSWVVRTRPGAANVAPQMQSVMAGVDPTVPFTGFYTMSQLMASTLVTQRIEVSLLAAMAALALLLSMIGIFGLVANIVLQRTREIGIRIALGSSIARAMSHIAKVGLVPAAIGAVVGLALCGVALRIMRSALYGVQAWDAPTLLSAFLLITLVSLAAAALPTLRVAHIDPAKTLREE